MMTINNKSSFKSFETERLFLVPVSEEDALFMLELVNTPKWLQFIGNREVHTIQDALAYIQERILPQFEKIGFGTYTLIRKSDHAKIGTVGLYDRPDLEGVDIGFAFLPQYEQQGYAFEAAKKLKEVAFEVFNLSLLQAIILEENIASQKLVEKLGFSYSKKITLPADPVELLLFELSLP